MSQHQSPCDCMLQGFDGLFCTLVLLKNIGSINGTDLYLYFSRFLLIFYYF